MYTYSELVTKEECARGQDLENYPKYSIMDPKKHRVSRASSGPNVQKCKPD